MKKTILKKENYGGQALIEGVMMRGPKAYALAVRQPDGKIVVEKKDGIPWTKKNFFLGLPFIRGIVNLAEMLSIGISSLMRSAELSLEETPPTRTETFLSVSFSLLLAIGLFIVIPAFVFSRTRDAVENLFMLNLIEGLSRITIFSLFVIFTSFMPEMRRVFEYHGAEHKVIHTYEKMDAFTPEKLTVDSVKDKTTLHPSCGTSFIFIVLIVSIMVFAFLGRPTFLERVIMKLSLLPVIIGIAYEIIRAARKKNAPKLLRILIWPGVMFQKITTKEPDSSQIEVAIESFKAVYNEGK